MSAPLTHTKKVTMVSSGKGDVGVAKLSGEVLQIMEKLPVVVENLTGINIQKVCIQIRESSMTRRFYM